MQTSPSGLALIKRFEGFSALPYRCPAGKMTIGYGHVIRPTDVFEQGCVTEETAETLLKQDIAYVERIITRAVLTPINPNQFDALVSLAYNIGIEAFVNSTLLRLLNEGNPEAAAAQFARWTYAGGRKLDGLVQRRAAEAALFREV